MSLELKIEMHLNKIFLKICTIIYVVINLIIKKNNIEYRIKVFYWDRWLMWEPES